MVDIVPFGSWTSQVTADFLVEDVVRLSDVVVDGDDLYWVERRPTEAGRQVIVRLGPDGRAADVLPAPFSARTLVHEYGGKAYAVDRGLLWFSNHADQRLWRIGPDESPAPFTADDGSRYADIDVAPDGLTLVAV
ncbi:MAG: S9 family peptidase, partial [Acidimicrobiales bacterium]